MQSWPTEETVNTLFSQYAFLNPNITLDGRILLNMFQLTCGHAGLVQHCGKSLTENFSQIKSR